MSILHQKCPFLIRNMSFSTQNVLNLSKVNKLCVKIERFDLRTKHRNRYYIENEHF